MAHALHVDRVSSGYKASLVLRETSLRVLQGEAVALLGKNGMGKSTLMKTVMGYLPKQSGTVHIGDLDVTRSAPHQISMLGVAYAAQERALFNELSVRDNLRLGLHRETLFEERFTEIETVFPVFKSRLKQPAGTLSGGEQKMLLVARSLMLRPALLLLDEISEGVQPSVIDRIARALSWARERHGTTLLLVEQNVAFALDVADRYVVLKRGEFIDSGDARSEGARHAVFDHLQV